MIYFMAYYGILKAKRVRLFGGKRSTKMENREKLEIPTISFTPVTYLGSTGDSSCTCDGDTCPGVLTKASVNCTSD